CYRDSTSQDFHLSLHDALPIWRMGYGLPRYSSGYCFSKPYSSKSVIFRCREGRHEGASSFFKSGVLLGFTSHVWLRTDRTRGRRSEEHASELQSREKLVCCLVL